MYKNPLLLKSILTVCLLWISVFPNAQIQALSKNKEGTSVLTRITNDTEKNSRNLPDADSMSYYQTIKTYVNPVLGGDHPDPTLLKKGDDFYMCGSSFHFTPYLTILHSTDLVHWQEVSRVVSPNWAELKSDYPGAGIWQGAITYFYDSFWIYFSNGSASGQYFCKASSPKGPWSKPVKVKTTSTTGPIGYDNSIFVDDDGTPYMLTKSGKPINRIQKIAKDGHLTGDAINLDWINVNERYSWAEGPVMCKRNGWYYYSFAGNVAGGQYAYRSQRLTSDSTKWEALGNFFAPIGDPATGFRVSNHMSAPFQLQDGSWWALAQSYERIGSNDWSGQGRQSLLHKIEWDDNGKPAGTPATSFPLNKPVLPKSGLSWKLPRSDYFNGNTLQLSWHFLNKKSAGSYSLNEKNGWLTITPTPGRSHILQKESGHYYTLVSRVNMDAVKEGEEGGIYLTNGDESVVVKLFNGFSNGKKIIFTMGNVSYQAENKIGKTLWLKLDRREHDLYGYYSADGISWKQVGDVISAVNIDKEQPNFNRWVGTSIGLYAEGKSADFDLFLYKDGFSELPVAGYSNYFGVEKISKPSGKVVTNTTAFGGWLMLGGVNLGDNQRKPGKVEILASSLIGGDLELWVDDLGGEGKKIATITISSTGNADSCKKFSSQIIQVSGQHDIYLKFPCKKNAFYLSAIRFIPEHDDSLYE